MMSVLVCMLIHWIRLMVNHEIDYCVVMIPQITILHGLLTFIEY